MTRLSDKFLLFISIIFFGSFVYSQGTVKEVFTLDQFLEIVIQEHPVALQAKLATDKGQAYLIKAKGGFDPKIYGGASQKYFDGTQYYSLIGGGLKLPTWFGVELDAGYDIGQGKYINPENATAGDGLWRAGVKIPLGKNLMIDARRATLKQAKIYEASSVAQGQMIMNKLVYDATVVYWDWFKAYHKMKLYALAVENASIRLKDVKKSAVLGDKPFMDTLESHINLQQRVFSYANYQLHFKNAQAKMDLYLWQNGYIPLELSPTVLPPNVADLQIAEMDLPILAMLDSLSSYHPKLLKYQAEVDIAKVDVRLSKEQLKPEVNIKYNALNAPVNGNPWQNYSINNYKWGAEVSFPVFIRKERGALKLNQLALQDAQVEMTYLKANQTYDIWAYYNGWQTSIQQINVSRDMVTNYTKLLSGEQKLFNLGESSVFLLNAREKSLIEAQLNLIEATISNQKAKVSTAYALGILPFNE
ncbi:hypothetical protein DNU06_05570 [Putridiphycobacter roseus]|uniref:Transporter n=1 Tax=Putridiphycobacter roseus TaxID=2219161 RepID=A0A2W1N2K9_9FLAO|nr:TolC family protein [Putridiphycobacter roseus]PZE18084.1 hypothetical protein DNU06_05570 [Putridiphycobacter roseus]